MKARVYPGALQGSVAAIPSKSDVHRLLICAALADKPTVIHLPYVSDDMSTTVACLEALGAAVEHRSGDLYVTPAREAPQKAMLDCRESGSTLRFLLPVAATLCGNVSFAGSGRLPHRPIEDLVVAMEAHGVTFGSRTLPLEISGRLTAGVYSIPGNVSSQYLTGLLLALPRLEGDSVIRLTTPLESHSYIDVTLSALSRFGVRVRQEHDRFFVSGGQTYRSPGKATPGGDWSSAAFFLAAGALGAPVTVTGLDATSPQGDRKLVELLERFGAKVTAADGETTVGPGKLRGCEVDMSDIPDLLPILSVVATAARGQTHLAHAARLRLKESDRLSASVAMLRALGGNVREMPDGIVVTGGELHGGEVSSFGDHRMAMAAAIAATRCDGSVLIDGAQAVSKSYPSFFEDFAALGGRVDVI